ncbi:MAG TPA: host attachment protein [Thiomicrorhabdus sp.]|nr:host attachment protein [Thiomicrorhabdus sp.]
MKPAWILIADSSKARIFTAENSVAELIEVESLSHSESRLSDQELTSDLAGRANVSQSTTGHVYVGEVDPKEQETINFAKQVAQHLCHELNLNKFENLFVVASPNFLGVLRRACSNQLKKHIVFSLNKNVVTKTPEQIRTYLPVSLMV